MLFAVISVYASAYDFTVDGIYYNILSADDKTCAVTYRGTSYNSYSGDVTIPAEVAYNDVTYKVTGIGEKAFSNCNRLKSIIIPDGVTGIGERAFYFCTSLTSIDIPENVTSIGKDAFYYCSKLVSINISGELTSIGEYAFYCCTSLTSITIPESVTSIGRDAFCGCESLTSINIPDGVTSIESGVFWDCSSLTSIKIPDGVTSIGYSAFNSCKSLTSVTIPDGVTSIERLTFYGCSSLKSINIPDGVTSIGESAFYCCTSLTEINIPEKVTSIGEEAFYQCMALKRIFCYSETVPTLGSFVFTYVPSTCVLYLPNGKAEDYKKNSQFSKFLTTDVTVTEAGWASGCLTYPAKAPSGTAYYISSINSEIATLTEFPNGEIPYCEGFLYRNTAGTYTFTDADETPEKVKNLLYGTTETMSDLDAGSIYVLGLNDAGKIGIRCYTGTELSGNKAYIKTSEIPAEVLNSIAFGFDDETTGVSEVSAAKESGNDHVFNLQGQRMATPRSGQIYIKNGKKFIK